MKHFPFVLVLLFCYCNSTSAQVKRQYQDNKNKSRTIVVKDDSANDYDILDKQFKDAKPGQVIRITTDKPPRQQNKKPSIKKTYPKATPKAKLIKKNYPKINSKKTVKQKPLPPNTWKPSPKINYGDFKWKRSKKPRRKKYSNRKKHATCFRFN